MTEQQTLRCVVCGGNHEPHPRTCSDEGMDREAKRMGARKWNAVTGQVQRAINKGVTEQREQCEPELDGFHCPVCGEPHEHYLDGMCKQCWDEKDGSNASFWKFIKSIGR